MQKKILNRINDFGKIYNKVKWKLAKKNISKIGKNNQMGRNFCLIGSEYMEIGENFFSGESVKLEAWDSYQGKELSEAPHLIIGDNVKISSGCHISCANVIIINNGVLLGPNVFICDNFHGHNSWEERNIPPAERPLWIKGKVCIGKNVWIGRNVCVMPKVNIGEGAVIGANAVVTHDIPAYTIAAGIPAKVISKIERHN